MVVQNSTINEWGPHVLTQVFKRIDNFKQVMGVFSYVNKTWFEGSILYFESLASPLRDTDGIIYFYIFLLLNYLKNYLDTTDLSSVVNVYGGTLNFLLQHLRYVYFYFLKYINIYF